MKVFKKIFLGLVALSLLTFHACREVEYDIPSGETILMSLRITNAGFSGTGVVAGIFTEEGIVFTVPAETNIGAIVFNAVRSLGANIDGGNTQDFLGDNDPLAMQFSRSIRLVSGVNHTDYNVIINLTEPDVSNLPLVDRIVISVDGTERVVPSANIDNDDKMIYLAVPEGATEVKLVSLTLRPARSATNIKVGDKVENFDVLELDFHGITNKYTLDFRDVDFEPGINFAGAKFFDFSTRTDNRYPAFANDHTRSADFNGEHVLIVQRAAPRLHRVADLMQMNTNNPIMLDLTGVSGGTHVMSAGRLSHGRIYITNLTTAASEILTVYYYETPESTPQRILEYAHNPAVTTIARWGDNMSVNLDANGDGYIFFVHQDPGTEMLRFTVRNFTEVDPESALSIRSTPTNQWAYAYYAFVNPIGTNRNLITSTYAPVIRIIDNEGNPVFTFDKVNHPDLVNTMRGTDARIFTHNRGRYLMMSTVRFWGNLQDATLAIYDISEGADLMTALANYQSRITAGNPIIPWIYQLTGSPSAPAWSANTNWAVINGNLVVFVAAANAGFALIEIPNN